MDFIVTENEDLKKELNLTKIDVKDAINKLSQCKKLQLSIRTNGFDPHTNDLLFVQLGNDSRNIKILIDCLTIDLSLFKYLLENKKIIGYELKFDLQFLFKYNIIPRKTIDICIIEQTLFLGITNNITIDIKEYEEYKYNYPVLKKSIPFEYYKVNYSFEALLIKYLDYQDGKIIGNKIISKSHFNRTDVINLFLENSHIRTILKKQIKYAKEKKSIRAIEIECNAIPAMAYLEWCGIKLDVDKWNKKIKEDLNIKIEIINELNKFLEKRSALESPKSELNIYLTTHKQYNIFTNLNELIINWDDANEFITICKILGFNIPEIKKNKSIDYVLKNILIQQKEINNEFIELYIKYKKINRIISKYNTNFINGINPKTNRIHALYNQIGSLSGRMSCGVIGDNLIMMNYSNPYLINIQQIPKGERHRSCFISEPNNSFCSCDYNSMEARMGADIYNEEVFINEFLYGTGDTHSVFAKILFPEELKNIETKDVSQLRPDLREIAKSVEYSIQFGSTGYSVSKKLGIPIEKGQEIVNNILSKLDGLSNYKEYSKNFILNNGYVDIMPEIGYKIYWHNYKKWIKEEQEWDEIFWKEYYDFHINEKDKIYDIVENHKQQKKAWTKLALNTPTQGGGAIILKTAITDLFNWIVTNGYFNKILLVNLNHDEINSEFPKELKEYPNIVAEIMRLAAYKYYKRVPLTAKVSVGNFWIH